MPLILNYLSFTFGEEIMGMKGARSNNLHSDPLFLEYSLVEKEYGVDWVERQ